MRAASLDDISNCWPHGAMPFRDSARRRFCRAAGAGMKIIKRARARGLRLRRLAERLKAIA